MEDAVPVCGSLSFLLIGVLQTPYEASASIDLSGSDVYVGSHGHSHDHHGHSHDHHGHSHDHHGHSHSHDEDESGAGLFGWFSGSSFVSKVMEKTKVRMHNHFTKHLWCKTSLSCYAVCETFQTESHNDDNSDLTALTTIGLGKI